MKLIVGLGNPGKAYAGTRHNIGFDVVDALAKDMEATFRTDKSLKAEIAETRLGSEKVLLAKPTTFMNLSGDAVRSIVSFYKIPLEDVLIIQDEMDYAPGTFAFSIGNGPGGHNGITSIQESLASKNFARLRIGIGRPSVEAKEDYVLGRMSNAERSAMTARFQDMLHAIKDWMDKGLTKTMNVWNAVKGDAS